MIHASSSPETVTWGKSLLFIFRREKLLMKKEPKGLIEKQHMLSSMYCFSTTPSTNQLNTRCSFGVHVCGIYDQVNQVMNDNKRIQQTHYCWPYSLLLLLLFCLSFAPSPNPDRLYPAMHQCLQGMCVCVWTPLVSTPPSSTELTTAIWALNREILRLSRERQETETTSGSAHARI